MRISVFGLGYVGAVTATCFAESGHHVTGVEINREKIAMVNDGSAPIVEPELQERLAAVVGAGRLRATSKARDAVCESDLSMICVGTPTNEDGSVALEALDSVVAEIGGALREKQGPHAVVVRSTVPPGTTEGRVSPILVAASSREIGEGLELCCNPEFLREGTALRDFYHPPFTVIGCRDGAGPPLLAELYRDLDAPLFCTSFAIAEAVKTVSNSFHALKIAFANEVGSLLRENGVDGRAVMRIFCEDRKLNVSSAYLRPGFAFGGSCLPKDTRALVHLGEQQALRLPLLERILVSNEAHVERAYRLVARNGRKSVALFGIAFKPGTDDLRDSPLVALAERLTGKGFPLRIYDPSVEVSRLTGRNRAFIEQEMPHLGAMMVRSPEQALEQAEIIVIGHAGASELSMIADQHRGRPVIDLQGVELPQVTSSAAYRGICW